jgi:hypothetical protein
MSKRFDEDNYKHWKDTFKFQSYDEDNAEYKDVKINMEDVMDRIDHYRKKYDEDDAFVRAVIDTHENIVKIMFTKDLAHLIESSELIGFAKVLQTLNESRGEMEIWSVARPADGNWFLVKGSFNKRQLANMDLHKKERPNKEEEEKNEKPENGLKKKEETAILTLKTDEVSGLEKLPIKIKGKVKEKMAKGWTTETPFQFFIDHYTESEINSVFNDKIKIFKLKPTYEFFESLKENSPKVNLKRGFCRSIYLAKNDSDISEDQEKIVNHIINKCDQKFEGKLGIYRSTTN